jgi:hypothetical protein
MLTRPRHGPRLSAVTLIIVLGCSPISEERAGEPALGLTRPGGNDLVSLGPDEGTRVYYQFIDERSRLRFGEQHERVAIESDSLDSTAILICSVFLK